MRSFLKPGDWHRVMVIATHPDDETLAAGGLLQQVLAAGGAVRIVFATDGDNNPWPQRMIERRWRIGAADRARWGARRRAEALSALECLGIPADNAVFLHYPDQGLTSLLLGGHDESVITLAEEIAAWRPTLLVVPSEFDLHPDHSALAVLVRFARARLAQDRRRFTQIRYWVHGPRPEVTHRHGYPLRLLPQEQARKREAILRYASQLALSRRRFLSFAQGREWFIGASDPIERDDDHAVRLAAVKDRTLHLQLAMRMRPAAFGPATLYIAGDDSSGKGVRLSIPIPHRPGEVGVRDVVSDSVVTQARFRAVGRRRAEILLPLSALLPAESVFVKLRRRFGSFYEDGWREVPLGPSNDHGVLLSTAGRKKSRPGPNVCCVIPCYNVATLCGEVVREAAAHADHVIAVDDGSTDGTGEVLRKIAADGGGRLRVLSFLENRGKGVALLEGFRHAIEALPFDVLVTLDGDRQHYPADIPRLVRVWREEGAALVIGQRDQFGAMPFRSRFGNTITSALLRRVYAASPLDTQSGMRALDRNFVREVLRLVLGQRYETELKILLLALRQQRRIRTVPIQTLYLNGNRSSHFRPVLDSLRIYWTLLGWRLPVSESDP